jgi:hypothetical protein
MMMVVAVGVPSWPRPSGGFDWQPLLMVLVALFLVRFLIGLSVTWSTATVSLAAGSAWGWSIDAWGVLPPTVVAMTLAITASLVVDRTQGRSGPSASTEGEDGL